MEDVIKFKKRIESAIERSYMGNVVLLPFLDETYGAILEEMCKYQKAPFEKYGKIINADRNRYILSQYDVSDDEFKIVVYKIKYNKKYYEINHRNVLGSLMGLGIKRESLGDIVINNGDVYIACTEEISKFIESEFKFVGKAPIELEEYNERIENVIRYEDKNYFISSLRIDCVISAIYGISRSEAQELIIEGLVQVNHIINMNVSHVLKIDDIVSVRHKGKFKVTALNGKTRSDRLNVTLSKRV